MKGNKLKALQVKSKNLNYELNDLNYKLTQLKSRIDYLQGEKDKVDKRISFMTKEPVVSEHALLRYLERKYDFDVEQIKDEILTKDFKELINSMGDANYTIPGTNLKAIVKSNVIITITPQ